MCVRRRWASAAAFPAAAFLLLLSPAHCDLQVSMDAGSNRIFKLNLQPSAANPCPIIVIRLSNELGPVDMYGSLSGLFIVDSN